MFRLRQQGAAAAGVTHCPDTRFSPMHTLSSLFHQGEVKLRSAAALSLPTRSLSLHPSSLLPCSFPSGSSGTQFLPSAEERRSQRERDTPATWRQKTATGGGDAAPLLRADRSRLPSARRLTLLSPLQPWRRCSPAAAALSRRCLGARVSS